MFKSRTCLFSVCTPNTIEWTTKKQIQLMLFGVKTHSQITDYGCSIVHMVRQAASQTKKNWRVLSTGFNMFQHTCRILQILQVYTYLVGGFNHLEKYESQWEGLSRILWKSMFETTNQYIYIYHIIHAWIEQWPKVPPFWLPSHWLRRMQPPERANGVDTSHEKTVQLGTSKHQGESQKPCPYNVGLYMGNIPVT